MVVSANCQRRSTRWTKNNSQQGKVVRGNVEVLVDETDEHGVVDGGVVDTLEDVSTGLGGHTSVVTGNLERGVGDVQLTDPSDESGLSRLVGDRGNIRVVGANVLSRGLPLEVNSLVGSSDRCLLGIDSCLRIVTGERDIVGDGQLGEDLPSDLGVGVGASDNVLGKQGPRHGLRDTSLEVKRHGESSRELSESHLLSSLGGDRLQKQSSSRSRVEVG
jgi:hypothetical protein